LNSRHYSSFLLRLWLVEATFEPGDAKEEIKDQPQKTGKVAGSDPTTCGLVLQLQHLQSGTTWRFNSLKELDELLGQVSDCEHPELWLEAHLQRESEMTITETMSETEVK